MSKTYIKAGMVETMDEDDRDEHIKELREEAEACEKAIAAKRRRPPSARGRTAR